MKFTSHAKAELLAMMAAPAVNPANLIPEMTEPLGRYWDQPSRDDILVDDKTATMTSATLMQLADYSSSYPSGVYPGKMWRRDCVHGWALVWYGHLNDKQCSIHHRDIEIVESLPVPSAGQDSLPEQPQSPQDKEIETLRMQLAACGVIALCNTPESLKQQGIGPDNPYYSDSYKQVESGVRREMLLMQEVERLSAIPVQLAAASAQIGVSAIMDFLGYVTTRDEVFTASAKHDCGAVMDVVKAFLALRGTPNCNGDQLADWWKVPAPKGA